MYIFPNFGDYSSQHHHDEMNSPDVTPSVLSSQAPGRQEKRRQLTATTIILLLLLPLLLPLGSVEFLVNAAPPRKIFLCKRPPARR
jgi:hypothetical protein